MLVLAIGVALVAQIGQATPMTPAEANKLAAAVFNSLVPPAGTIDARPTAGRVLFVDEKQTLHVLQGLVSSGTVAALDFGRPFVDRTHDDVIHCAAPGHKGCAIDSDGIFVSIVAAEQIPAKGQVHVKGTVRWVDHRDPHGIDGFDMDFYLARVATGWQILRRSAFTI